MAFRATAIHSAVPGCPSRCPTLLGVATVTATHAASGCPSRPSRDTCCRSRLSESRHMLPLPVVRVVQVVRVATHAAPGCRIVSLRHSLFQNLNRGRGRASDSEPRWPAGGRPRGPSDSEEQNAICSTSARASSDSEPRQRPDYPGRGSGPECPGWHPALTVAAPVYDGVTGSGSSRPAAARPTAAS